MPLVLQFRFVFISIQITESKPTGKWTEWINDVDPYEDGRKGDFELRNNMDPVSGGQSWQISEWCNSVLVGCIFSGKC